jgi:hypothetical protein
MISMENLTTPNPENATPSNLRESGWSLSVDEKLDLLLHRLHILTRKVELLEIATSTILERLSEDES